MSGRCCRCYRLTATRGTQSKSGGLVELRVGFVKEARNGVQLAEPVLVCLPCLIYAIPDSVHSTAA